jgi:hypothetical protein
MQPVVFAALALFLVLLLIPLSCGGGMTLQAPSTASFTLVWSDEFSGPDGSSPDTSKWTYNTGGNGWGNNELEYYTSRIENSRITGGKLVITAQRGNYTGPTASAETTRRRD